MFKIKYSIVTPARNEEKIIHGTLKAVVNQSITPKKWIIMDDGSTDRTGEILDHYAKTIDWIEVVHIDKKIKNYRGAQEKLYLGFDKINLMKTDFIGKLDADIEIPENYYETLFEKFEQNPKLGIAGGTLFYIAKGGKVVESCPVHHVRGGLKLYRRKCWNDIGGMEFKLAYDTIDEIKASMFGWETRSFEDIMALHHRPTGKEKGLLGWCIYRGKVSYMAGYHPLFLLCKCVKNMGEKPYVFGGIAELIGFLSCYFDKTERTIDDREFIEFFRKMQIKRLFRRRFW